MDSINLEQIFEIFGYIWDQINWNKVSGYYKYGIIAVVFILSLIIIKKIISKFRAVNEYIENGIAFIVEFPLMGNKGEKLESVLEELYKEIYDKFGRKYYFAVEILIRADREYFFFYVPRKIYDDVKFILKKNFSVKIVTESREKFIEKMNSDIIGYDLELGKDFIFPLNLKRRTDIRSIVQKNELVMIQIVCRPTGDRWRKNLERYLQELKKGKDKIKFYSGCSGGFIGFILVTFSFLGDLLTSVIHGEGINREDDKKFVKDELKGKYDAIKRKLDKIGYETAVRVFVDSSDMDREYQILDKLLEVLSVDEDDEYSNSYVVKRLYKKFKDRNKNELIFANINKDSLDILNRDEVSRLILLLGGFD